MNWRKLLKRSALAIGLFIVVLAIAGFFLLRSRWFHQAVLTEIVTKAQAATGGKLNIQSWNFNFHPLTIELRGITLHGSEPAGALPLLAVDKLTVGVKVRPLLDRKLELSELIIEHPVANVRVTANGTTNIPAPPPSSTKSSITVWNLAVGRTLLNRGDIQYNDKQLQLDADLSNLQTEVRFDPSLTQYEGNIAYQNGRLKYADYSSLPHALKAHFSATPSGASLDSLLLTVGASHIAAHAKLVNYEKPDVSANYEVLIHTQDFSSLSRQLSPAGDLRIDGGLEYRDVAGQSLLRSLSAEGSLSSESLEATSTEARLVAEKFSARYRLANGDFHLQDAAADVIGGRFNADLSMRDIENMSGGDFRASIERASIASARLAMRQASLRQTPVTGTVKASARGSWTQGIKNLQLAGDAQVTAAVWQNASERGSSIPIDAVAHFSYNERSQSLALKQTSVQIPAASAMINGEIGSRSRLQVHASSGDLRRLAELATALQSGSSHAGLPISLSGKATLDAIVEGSLARPSISGQILAQDLQVQGSQWKTAQLKLSANPSQINISQASIVSARQGNLNFTAQVGLRNWSYQPANSINAHVTTRDISLAELEHLAVVNYPVEGNFSADISLQGSQLHPAGHGSLHILNATAYGQPVQDLSVQFRTEHDSIDSSLSLNTPAGSASGTVSFTPSTKAYNVNIQAPQIVIQKLQTVSAKSLPVSGTVAFSARGSGTVEHPQLAVYVQVPALQIRDTTLNGLNADLKLDNRRASLSLNSNVAASAAIASASNSPAAQAYVRANANVDLTGDYNTAASIDTGRIPLAPFLAVYAPNVPESFDAETELHASITGPLKDRSKLVAHLTIPSLTGTYQALQFASVNAIHADYADSVLVLQPAEIRGTQTSIRLQGRVPLGNSAPISATADGSVNLQLLAMFDADVQSRGSADFNIRATGSLPHPDVRGQVQIKNAAFTTSTSPAGISKVNGTLDLTREKVQVTSLTGEVGGGQVSAGGSIVLTPTLQFNLALQGRGVRVLYPAGVRTVLDADLTFTGDMKAAALRGRTLIQSLTFTPDFNLSTVAAQFSTPSVPPATSTFSDAITLAISVQSSQNLTARSSQLSLSGMTNLRVAGTVGDPVIIGRVDLASGELFFMSNRYELQRGIVSFNDPNQTRPVLNIQATTTIEQYNLTLTITGPLDRLSTSYVSNPALPTADIISLIYRGQTVEEAAAAGTSTGSLLASGAASQFSSGLRNLTGISSLQIDPLLGGNGTNPSARIAVQQRVTRNFLFTFSTDVTQPESDIVLGQYQLTPRWSVSVERDQLGGVSVDGQLRTKF